MFRRLAGAGKALLVSSHVMDEAAQCDDLLLMREGRLLAAGTREDVLRAAGTHDLEAAFLALIERDQGAPAAVPA
jgi:ABC-2 type transport system ATP-binding protein